MGLLQLANELLLEIIGHAHSLDDVSSISATCRAIYSLVAAYRLSVAHSIITRSHTFSWDIKRKGIGSTPDSSTFEQQQSISLTEAAPIARRWFRLKELYQAYGDCKPGFDHIVSSEFTNLRLSPLYRHRSGISLYTFYKEMSYEGFYLALTRIEFVMQLRRTLPREGDIMSEHYHSLWSVYQLAKEPYETLAVYDFLSSLYLPHLDCQPAEPGALQLPMESFKPSFQTFIGKLVSRSTGSTRARLRNDIYRLLINILSAYTVTLSGTKLVVFPEPRQHFQEECVIMRDFVATQRNEAGPSVTIGALSGVD